MTVKLVGSSIVPRIITGLYSFDRAFSNQYLGFPACRVIEVGGVAHVGKSTFVHSLSGILAREMNTNIVLFDNEGYDSETLITQLEAVKFDGTVYSAVESTDENNLDFVVSKLMKQAKVGIVDSAGSISPYGEVSGKTGEANMGKRAYILGQFVRKVNHINSGRNDSVVFVTNHLQVDLGGFGMSTTGGKSMTYGPVVKLGLSRKDSFPNSKDDSIGFLLQGTVKKNRFGGKGKEFYVAILSGFGVSIPLTAMFDCIALKLVTRPKDRRFPLKVGDVDLPPLKSFFRYALDGREEEFSVFYDLLKEHESPESTDDGEIDDEREESDAEIV